MSKNQDSLKKKSLEKEAKEMNTVKVDNYNKEQFLYEFKESLKEAKEMKEGKKKSNDSSWRDLFIEKDK